MTRKIISSILVALHIFTFGYIRDGLAALCESPNYKLDIAAYTEGGPNRNPAQPGYTKLLLHADGANGQTTFTDEAGKTVTANGNARIDTAQSKFGGASGLFDGTGSYLSLANSDDWNFGAGDFTIDFWMRPAADNARGALIERLAAGQRYFVVRIADGNVLYFAYSTNGIDLVEPGLIYAPGFAKNTWYHIAIVRSGNNLYAFINGVKTAWTGGGSADMTGVTLFNSASAVEIGADINGAGEGDFNGSLDELRVSKGIARWTSDFTPPDAPYTLTLGDPQGAPTNTIKDSTGEPAIGNSQSASYKLNAGFLYVSQSNPPELTQSIPHQTWQVNTALANAFDLDDYFSSPDGLTLHYIESGSKNITVAIDPATHLVSFSQAADWADIEKVIFIAIDSEGNTQKSNEVVLQVQAPQGANNKPAILDALLDPSIIKEGDLIKMTVKARDLDDNDLTFNYASGFTETRTYKQDGLWFSEAAWQTASNSAGHYNIRVTVKDPSGLFDTKDVLVNVGNLNHPPILNPIADITINEGETAIITPNAADPDGDTITFYYEAPFNSLGRWQTDYKSAGAYNIKVAATDGIDTVYQTAKIVINNTNQPPIINDLTPNPATAAPGQAMTITFKASDLDEYDTALNFTLKKINRSTSAEEVISSGVINNNEAQSISASIDAIGYYIISLTVTDTKGASTTAQQNVHIYDPNENRDAVMPIMGDFNGDSLSDLGMHNSDTGAWEICLSDKGAFTAASLWLTGFGASKDCWPMGGDFNGDGKTDIGIYNNTTGELKIALSDGTKFTPEAAAWLTFPNTSYSWIPFTGNFNGDKYTDFGAYNKETGEIKIARGTGTGFAEFTTWLTGFGALDYTPITGDFNGDGLTDICIFKKSTGEFKVAFSNTKAFIAQTAPWITNYAVDKDPVIADFNNDGLTDIGYFDKASGKWYYALNTGAGFVDSGVWLEGFGSSDITSAQTGDFDGNGLTDAATFDKTRDGINKWAVKLSTNKPQDLLVEIDNGIGGKTAITYQYASTYNNDLLPFPVYVASQISSINTTPADRAATYTQNFTYEGGWFDADSREFRGFSKIRVTDPISGNYTETEFYQGKPPQDGALKGQIKQIAAYDSTSKKISEAVNSWEVRKAGPTDGVLGFPYLKEVTQTIYEIGEVCPITTKNEFTYDNLGNITQEKCNGDVTVTGDEKFTETVYSLPYEQGHNRPEVVTLKDKDANIVNSKTFEYDNNGNLTQETAYLDGSNDPSTQYSYDSFGNVTSTTNASGHRVLTDYESVFYTYPEKVTNELGHTIQYEYNPKFGSVTRLTDVNGNTTETAYDTLARITSQKNTQGQVVTSYSYPDFNTKVTTQLNLTKTEYIDGLGRAYKSVSDGEDGAQKRQVSSEVYFNNRGLKEAESLPHYIDESPDQISYIRYAYDLRGRITSTTSDFPGVIKDATSSINYINPLYIETTDPKGARKGTRKDVYDNTIEIIEFTQPGEYHTYYEYDLKGNLTKLTDSKGNITQIQYDRLGRKTLLNDPDTGITTYTYDKLGNLLTQTDNKGQTISMEYDALSRLKTKSSLRAAGEAISTLATYEYDDTTKSNCLGRLSKITTPDVTTSYFYDSEGRANKLDKTIDGTTYTTQTTYDLIGRTTSITYPDNSVINYTYDTNSGLLEKVSSLRGAPGGGDEAISYVQDITYNAKGQIRTIQYGNNTETDYTYGQDLRLSRILTSLRASPQGGEAISTYQDLNYDFDKAGNITTLTDNLRSNIRSYTYDDLNRLTKAENTPDPNGGGSTGSPQSYTTFNYQYDQIGNMTYKSDLGFMTYGEGTAGPHAITAAGPNTYTYDLNGNMISGPNKLMTYDSENRMIKLETSTDTTTFTYDADGSRIKKSSLRGTAGAEAISTTYISSLFEKDSDGTIRKHIFAGANRVATTSLRGGETTEAISYYHSDHLGSSNIITDSSGAQVQHCEYTPYGTLATNDVIASPEGAKQSHISHYFTGKELDNTGLYFYAWRYYDPAIGRFCQPDTIIPQPYNPQTLNRYTYCDNNPLNYTDPSGHFSLGKWLGKIIGAIAGVITACVAGPIAGFQVYSAISSIYDTGYALAHGADPLRTICAFVAANVLSAVMPGVPDAFAGDVFAQVAIGAARGAVIGGVTAAIAGGDVGQGILWGASTGAIVGFAGSQQFQNAIQGNGFMNNAELIRINELKVTGQLQIATNSERGSDNSALSPRSYFERHPTAAANTKAFLNNLSTYSSVASATCGAACLVPSPTTPVFATAAGVFGVISATSSLVETSLFSNAPLQDTGVIAIQTGVGEKVGPFSLVTDKLLEMLDQQNRHE